MQALICVTSPGTIAAKALRYYDRFFLRIRLIGIAIAAFSAAISWRRAAKKEAGLKEAENQFVLTGIGAVTLMSLLFVVITLGGECAEPGDESRLRTFSRPHSSNTRDSHHRSLRSPLL